MDDAHEIEAHALAAGGLPRTQDLTITGEGVIRDLDLTGLTVDHVRFRDGLPGTNMLLPRALRRARRHALTFVDCDFSGMQTRWLAPQSCRFVRCRFEELDVRGGLINAHFVSCTFSGLFELNPSARPDGADPHRAVEVAGNDMARATGFSFYDGVPREANRFDLGRSQLILDRRRPYWDELRAWAAERDAELLRDITSLEGRGPFGYNQPWQILHRQFQQQQTWAHLLGVIGLA